MRNFEIYFMFYQSFPQTLVSYFPIWITNIPEQILQLFLFSYSHSFVLFRALCPFFLHFCATILLSFLMNSYLQMYFILYCFFILFLLFLVMIIYTSCSFSVWTVFFLVFLVPSLSFKISKISTISLGVGSVFTDIMSLRTL